MEKIIINRPLTRTSYLEKLFREFGVSLLMADEHFNKNQCTLKKLKFILDSDDEEDTCKCLALLHILTYGNSYGIVRKYCKYKNKQKLLDDPDQDLLTQITRYTKKYKLDLLSSLLYDDAFFDEVKKWYQNIYNWRIFDIVEIIKPSNVETLAATPAPDENSNKRLVHTNFINIEEYYGKLLFLEYKQNASFEARFEFLDKDTEKSTGAVPPGLIAIEFDLVSDVDKSSHHIILDRPKTSELRSKKYYDIDYYTSYTAENRKAIKH